MFTKIINTLILIIILTGCSQDLGLSYSVEEKNEIIGEIIVQHGEVYRQALDILLIIDESCSMMDEAEMISGSLPDIYNELIGPDFIDLEWRVGVTSTDPLDGGVYDWVDWNDKNPEFALGVLGTLSGGHWGEQGLDSFLSSMLNDTDFHRPEADLLGIFVSDEEDASGLSIEDYEHLVSIYKEPPFKVTESAIVTTNLNEDRCNNITGLTIGERYMEVSEVVIDLCDTHLWLESLDYAKTHVPTLNEVWILDHVPLDLDHIEVYADEILWEQWHYNEEDNAIYLDKIPPAGSKITIVYLA